MKSQLPALIFSIPLFAAISMPMISVSRPRWCRPMALGAAVAMSATAVLNLALVLRFGETRYMFGGWTAPLGIEWVGDAAASLMAAAIAVIATVCLAYEGSVRLEASGSRVSLHYVLILLLLSGVVFAGDLFNVFVFLEVATLSTCGLIAIAGGKALVFAFRYLMLATIGATFFLLGVSFLYAVTGTLNMADMAERLAPLEGSSAVIIGVVFMFLGLAIKMALMPFHGWLPDAYTLAPDAISPLISALVTKVSLFAWIRIMYWVLDAGNGSELARVLEVCWILGSAAAVVGACLALIQVDLKRMFAYGGVSHIGLIMLGAGLGNQAGLAGSLFYLINDAVMQATLFVLAGIAGTRYGVRRMEELGQLRRRAPWLAGGLIVVALSMVGIPPTGGFFGKWYMVLGAVQAGHYLAVAAVIVATLLTLGLFANLLVRVFGSDVPAEAEPHAPMSAQARFCVGALCAGIVLLGVWSDPIVGVLLDVTQPLRL
jgi:multicomponent Na+:H+ antiporter subunit D